MPDTPMPGSLAAETARRRTFAIISHPDAGKTTLTEKLLLYSGAIRTAGSVKARKSDKHATSDWMDIEKQRGISVTSSAMQFEFDGYHINILDTPGHQDFSEDTYRVLVAADSAVMLIDAAKGVEAQTIKLFKVCRLRSIPDIHRTNGCFLCNALTLRREAKIQYVCLGLLWYPEEMCIRDSSHTDYQHLGITQFLLSGFAYFREGRLSGISVHLFIIIKVLYSATHLLKAFKSKLASQSFQTGSRPRRFNALSTSTALRSSLP